MYVFLTVAIVIIAVCVVVATRRKSDRNRPSTSGGSSRQPFSATADWGATDEAARRRPATLRWIGYGEALHVKGFEIAHPMTYVSASAGSAEDPSQIDRSLPVREAPHVEDPPYWPSYAHLAPGQRHLYLKWLASGRTTLPPSDGYLFIYYYGLERRALIDQQDQRLVFKEIQRLRHVYTTDGATGKRNSFMNYSSTLLWFLAAARPEAIRAKRIRVLAERTRTWNEDKLSAALAWFVQRNGPLPTWMAFIVAGQSPESRRSVVTNRVPKQFRELFTKRYEEQFGRGLQLRTAKRDRSIAYQPASAVISEARIAVPDALRISSQIRKLANIWNDCIGDLRKLSSIAAGKASAALTVTAWEAMPPDLRASVDHPRTEAVCDFVIAHTDEEGHVFVRAGELARTIDHTPGPRVPVGQSRQLAATLEHIGFAVEPDARLVGRGYKSDDLLVMFPQAYEGDPDPKRYGAAACMLRLGLAVAEADGRIDQVELDRVTEHIEEGFDLNEHERRRFEALRVLLLQTGSDISGLGRRLQNVLTERGRVSVGRLLVAVAAADGVVTKSELKALRRCFRMLGLGPEVLDNTLAELAPAADESPVTVVPGRPARPGEPIPRPREKDLAVRLDREAIARIMHETREVSVLLAEAMNIDIEAGEGGAEVTIPRCESRPALPPQTGPASQESIAATVAEASVSPGIGLSERYAAFYSELISRARWSRDEAEALARRHGHMLAGAIEAINDWSFEALDGQLTYDNGDEIEIEQDLLKGSV